MVSDRFGIGHRMKNISRRDSIVGLSALAAAACLPAPAMSASKNDPAAEGYRTPYKYNRLVLAKSSDPNSFDSSLIDCPFVFSANDRFYLMHVGHDGVGYQTGLAESDDLINWRKLGVIVGRDPKSKYMRYNAAMTSILRDDNIGSTATLKKVDGRYLGTWHAYPDAGYEQGAAVIGLAWSDDLMHWEIDEPVLRSTDGAAWEKGGLYKSYLVEADGVYYMFYNAKNQTEGAWFEQTGVATSRDLKTWTRYAGNPIIRNGPKGSPDEIFASDPFVVRNGDTWAAYYFGLGDGHARELLALGGDPFHFKKVNEVMIDAGPRGSIDEIHAHKPAIVSWRGDLYHFYCAVAGTSEKGESRGISVARSRPW